MLDIAVSFICDDSWTRAGNLRCLFSCHAQDCLFGPHVLPVLLLMLRLYSNISVECAHRWVGTRGVGGDIGVAGSLLWVKTILWHCVAGT